MKKIIEENELFYDDYKISGRLVRNEELIEYSYCVDENNYYLEIAKDRKINKYWFIKENDKYLFFLDNNKTYKYVQDFQLQDNITEIFNSEGIEFVYSLKQVYVNVSNNLDEFISGCDNCNLEYEKELFSKLTFTSKVRINSNLESEISYVLKRGKIEKTISKLNDANTSILKENSYEYSNQTIEIPSKSNYKLLR